MASSPLLNRRKAILVFFIGAGVVSNARAATYYVRKDGGDATQCTGLSDARYPGSGTAQPCAFNHPNWALSIQGNNPTKLQGGDTLIIDGSGRAQYMLGWGSPNIVDGGCAASYPWDCYLRPVPSGPSASQPTRILGKGYDTGCTSPPQLWGTERVGLILNLTGSNNIQVQCLEITDHSSCMEFGPGNPCQRDTPPFGTWAGTGIRATDSSNVLLKNINIHGLRSGVHAGRLTDWTMENVTIANNSFVGWDGDVGAFNSSNSGTILFKNSKILYSGCGETYPGNQPYNCYSQDQGGYGDGLGTHKTGANWVFDNVDISHNVSDGLDLLYHDGNGTITIQQSRFEGNAGNQVKVSAATTILNSILIGNCNYFNGQPFTWNPTGGPHFNDCRAGGNPIGFSYPKPGIQNVIYNSTVLSSGDTMIMTGGPICDGSEKVLSRNNIFLGGPQFNGGGDITDLFYNAGAGGNGDGPCGTIAFDNDYSVIWHTKDFSADCAAAPHLVCKDPKLMEPTVDYYYGPAYNVNIRADSPAIGKGTILSGLPAFDYNLFQRGSQWDIGALEFGSVPSTPPNVTVVPTGSLSSVRVFPNPWRADKHAGQSIMFDHLAASSSVQIFTVSGHKIKTLPTSNSFARWDLSTDAGDNAASGLYIYLITSGSNKARGKFAIIR